MVPNYTNLSKTFFSEHSNEYDLSTNEGCGKYTEAFVKHSRGIDSKIGHLKKNPGQTQYNGHANDAILYPTGMSDSNGEIYHAVDIIARAEQPKPWKPEGTNDPPEGQWSEDNTMYRSTDWLAEPGNNESEDGTQFPGYEDLGGDGLCRILVGQPLEADYKEAGQLMNDGSVVWTNRTIYDAMYYIFVDGMNAQQAYEKSAAKHRPEWRAALGL